MRHQWQVHRQIVPYADGQQRWDRAYQSLLQWSQAHLMESTITPEQTSQEIREGSDERERGHLRKGIYAQSSTSTDH